MNVNVGAQRQFVVDLPAHAVLTVAGPGSGGFRKLNRRRKR
jgi:hypothetical protein